MKIALLAMLTCFVLFNIVTLLLADAPQTSRSAVSDTYHGVEVIDEYRWLEDWNDPEVRDWGQKQNEYARSHLDALPMKKEIQDRLTELYSARTVSYEKISWQSGKFFALKEVPGVQQPFLVFMTSADRPEESRVIVDPNKIDPEGKTSIDWFVPSPDGQLLAVSMSKSGTEEGDVHVYETAAGRLLDGEIIPRVEGGTAGGGLAWNSDGSGFYYTHYPRGNERPAEDMAFYQQIYFHKLGSTTEKDRYELGQDFPRIAASRLFSDPLSDRVLAIVQNGDSGLFALYLRNEENLWQQLTDFDDPIVQAAFGLDQALYLISRENAPLGKILRLSLEDKEEISIDRAVTLIAESEHNIVSNFYSWPTMIVTESRLYLTYQLGGPSEIRVFNLDGTPAAAPEQLPVSSIGRITPLDGDRILFGNESYLEPSSRYIFDPRSGQRHKTALSTEFPVDLSRFEVVRTTAISKDGTGIPLNIIRSRDTKLDGSHPVILNGYGGFEISKEPSFKVHPCLWLEQGGIYAVANLRGGGEFGQEWHDQGRLTKKQNVFDDFTACLEYLVENNYTNSEKLSIWGGSNGGLLMGAMISQHPDRFAAVVSEVGIYDMLRVELSSNGAFNIPEYGTVKDPDQFKALYAYSPYHNIKDNPDYPPVLFTTGMNDPRVDPMQSRKMTARLQATASSSTPILLRISYTTGHGHSRTQKELIEERTDEYAFIFNHLNFAYKPVVIGESGGEK